jgi:anaphase-promoting complex subunit 5
MSRYLTPAKIALLALIELYVDGAVPNEVTIDVLSFIASHIVDHSPPSSANSPATVSPTLPSSSPTSSPPQPPPPSRWSKQFATITVLSDPSDFERLLSPHHSASGLPGRRLWDVFLSKLWAIDSLHALHDFLDRRTLCLAKTKEELRALSASGTTPPSPEDPEKVKLAPNSPFGAFVRRCVIEFRRLKFQDACGLWSEYVRYRQCTAGYWRRRSSAAGEAGRLSFDSVLLEGKHDWGEAVDVLATVTYGKGVLPAIDGVKSAEKIAVSFDDVEKMLEFQVHHMQSQSASSFSQSIKGY